MKHVQLILNNPCAEQWENMPKAGEGRYCDRCEKNIVDLTSKSDAELIRFFKKKRTDVCGRLLSSQLNRKLQAPLTQNRWHWLIPFAFTAVAITPSQAQELKTVQINATDHPKVAEKKKVLQPVEVKLIINLKVVDSLSGQALKGVRVRQGNFTNALAISDINGKIELSIFKVDMDAPFIFDFNGNLKTVAELHDGMVIKLKSEIVIMLGGISTIPTDYKPLYIIYSENKSCELEASKASVINPAWIEKVDVFQASEKAAIYGAKAAHGVIMIGIKKEYRNKFNFSEKK